ncbi:micronuclear linker histone polyprotein-like [Palaemon carinicauda]|uniref:micronuclear linker histone polyprotein-like n=1 Tax=Palaemon carinicauda TaxID=392227 RepID=UPI0035B6A8AC
MTVMQKQLFSLLQAFSQPSPQSDRCKDDSLPVKKSASKREWSSSPRESRRDSSKARYRASSSSTRRQDASDSRSRHQDDSVSCSRRQDDSSLLLQDDSVSRRQDNCSSRRKDASSSRRQDASAYRIKDSFSTRHQDDSSTRHAGGPSARRETVVDVEQDLDDVSEDEDKPSNAAGDYRVLSFSLLELYGEQFQPAAPHSPQSQFSRKKAKKQSAFIKMKLSISARKALAKVDEWMKERRQAVKTTFSFPPA